VDETRDHRLVALAAAVSAADNPDLLARCQRLTRTEMQAVIEFLSHDLLEGRAPGERGGQLAEAYMVSVFKLLGLEPGVGDSYCSP